jgi:hypothetical protein
MISSPHLPMFDHVPLHVALQYHGNPLFGPSSQTSPVN